MPKISIIVPVYNVEKYLSKCIDSIIEQTFMDWELLLIDDGSPDNSGKICDEYAQKDSRIRVFHKPNGGVSSARNLGLDKAEGKWVTFIDSDDYILPNFIEGLYKPIENGENVDFVHGGCYNVKDDKIVSVNQTYEYCIGDNPGYVFNKFRGLTFSKLFSLENVNHDADGRPLRFDENMKIAEDMAFTMDYLMTVKKYAFVEEKGYCYRCDNMSSATKKRGVSPYSEELHSFKHLFDTTRKYILKNNLSIEDSKLRLQQRGEQFAEVCFSLYRNNYPMMERILHLKKDFNEEEYFSVYYAKLNLGKRLLFYLLIRRYYMIFDFCVSISIKMKNIL